MKIYRIGLQFIVEDECLIRAKDRDSAIKKAKQLYKYKANVQTSDKDVWWVDYKMLDNIGKQQIID